MPNKAETSQSRYTRAASFLDDWRTKHLSDAIEERLMTSIRTIPTLALTLLASSGLASATAASPSVVRVDLMDPSISSSIKSMRIKTNVQSVKAGLVVFDVSNDSKTLVHEMIVVAAANPHAPLPYDKKDDRVNESKIADLGEASDLPPGEKKTLRLTLKPGNYELICNQPGHYKAGMKAILVVTQ
jgi:uncharacterized cupredoxin-like copper-binding protein